MSAALDLAGKRFGKLTAVRVAGRNRHGTRQWTCACDCGGETLATTGELTGGKREACRCGLRHVTHGERKMRLYRIWSGMKSRCDRPAHPRYARYGGRGIDICQEWRGSYPAFAAWARSNGYADEFQIDRIDNNGNYEPGNCRWTTAAVNMANRECSK
jgi:hypothetical protein